MKTTKLITGLYTPDEAKEILLDMVKSKINFHNIKSLSALVRFNKPDLESESRIKGLQKTREELLALIQQAENDNLNLRIESTIKVSFEAQEQPEEISSKAEGCLLPQSTEKRR